MARVLIIEDSNAQAAIIAEIVREAGHEALLPGSVQHGVAQILKSLRPDVVLLDLVLLGADGKPIADGFQICREIKRVTSAKIGVIVVSAEGDDEASEWAILQGADAYLQKPFVVEDLVEVLDEVLNRFPPGSAAL